MPNSMTGYGRGEFSADDRRVTVEIKSVNNRYCDIQVRLPRSLNALESRIRDAVALRLARGKVDVSISYADNRPDAYQVTTDLGLAKAYAKALIEIADAVGAPESPSAAAISRYADVLRVETAQVDPEEFWQLLEQALNQALDGMVLMRTGEGERLQADMLSRLDLLEQERAAIAERAPEVPGIYRERLSARLSEILDERSAALVDEQRLALEVAMFADKAAIDEELVRLASHLDSFRSILGSEGPIGKKLDFLIQEINREINTIGSKANDLQLTDRVVYFKSELEKIREQVQNLE
ncbi:MAG: YicC family protein [Ruminococcaceae bacterium]|nr:YicC family protein [Oscillospiraceae bacterium]